MELESVRVINAAGKLTALGGSAQTSDIANAMANAAGQHVDLQAARRQVANHIAELTGAEAACVTTGAAAGITISVASILCREIPELLTRLPKLSHRRSVMIQAGHNINFGADIEQMVHLSGADTRIAGSDHEVSVADLEGACAEDVVALLYVQSHHCIQDNRVDLPTCIDFARRNNIAVIVDAAAEEDLTYYINAGADLVTYSGGKAFGGPTSGFIVGTADLIELCEAQFQGIARTMKVGKEQLAGLAMALQTYQSQDRKLIASNWQAMNAELMSAFDQSNYFAVSLKPDEAGRAFERVAIAAKDQSFEVKELVRYLSNCKPSIRTRNHQLNEGRILIDPRELSQDDLSFIIEQLNKFERTN